MFYHTKRLQYYTKPDQPDPIYAKKLQEVLGGQYGEITVMMQYLFQGWNCRGPARYKDMLLDIGTEEIGHVEILSTLIAQLLEKAPISEQEKAVQQNPVVGAVMGGGNAQHLMLEMAAANPQHLIVSGQGATPTDSVGYPWNARYTISSGNLLADFRANLNAESQGRLQVVRLYELSDDPGVKDTLSFLIARDTMHQNQWIAAIQELEAAGLETTPVPSAFPQDLEKREFSYQFWNHSEGKESAEGRWAKGSSMDQKGEFQYIENPRSTGPQPELQPGDPHLYGTPKAREGNGSSAAHSVDRTVIGQ